MLSTTVEIIKSYNHNRPPFSEYLRGRGASNTSFCRSTFFVGNMTMTSFPGSTFSWQSNIYTYAFIYYNLQPVPKGVGVWVRLCLSPAVPASSPTSLLVAPIIITLASSWLPFTSSRPSSSTFHLPTATESRPINKKYYSCATFFYATRVTD